MPGYCTRQNTHTVGGVEYRLRVLADTQQYADPDGHALRLGISSAQWSLFGQCLPAGRLLAQAMDRFDIAGNALPAVHYRHLCWERMLSALGRCDAIIASDVLYERGQAERLRAVVTQHAMPSAEVWMVDPGRGHASRFGRLLTEEGFVSEDMACPLDDDDPPPILGRIRRYRRTAGAH